MHGPGLLKAFLVERSISRQKAAADMGVSTTALHYWLHGSQPRIEQRERIERYTGGAVPVSSWTRPEQADAIAAVQPAPPAPPSAAVVVDDADATGTEG